MTIFKLVLRNFVFYRKKNLTVILGIALGSAIIAGALMVGDSVRRNLHEIAGLRLGQVSWTLNTADRYTTTSLAGKVSKKLNTPVSPVLALEGMAVAEGGLQRANKIQVTGIDSSFSTTSGFPQFYNELRDDGVALNDALARKLNVKEGDEIILRIRKASLIPLNAPFVSDNDLTVSDRLTVTRILKPAEGGNFNLRISQTPPLNAFIRIEKLNELTDLEGKANLLLFRGSGIQDEGSIHNVIRDQWSHKDAGFIIRNLPESGQTEVLSERVFLDEPALRAITTVPVQGRMILTYFVNEISFKNSSVPYSFVSTSPDQLLREDEIILSSWAADDLKAVLGDTVTLRYFVIGPLRKLTEKDANFVIKEIVPLSGAYADRNLMPVIPGLTDADNCRDWETGIPIDLGKIRDKDEKYWDDHRGTPKAFISESRAVELWKNTYGSYTAVRFDASAVSPGLLDSSLSSGTDPRSIGFTVNDVANQSFKAADQGVDFGQLFAGLSFFVLVSAIILTILLLFMNLDGRRPHLDTMRALGIPLKTVTMMIHAESMILAITGAIAGTLAGIVYTKLVFNALNSVWMDIVRTGMLKVYISVPTLIYGFLVTLIISWLTLFLSLKYFMKVRKESSTVQKRRPGMTLTIFALAGVLISLALIAIQFARGEKENPGIFFTAGGLLLISLLLFLYNILNNTSPATFKKFSLFTLAVKNILRNKKRSISIIILLSAGTFIVLSTGSNRKNVFTGAQEKSGGTGGFLFYAESAVPFLKDPGDENVKLDAGINVPMCIVPFSLAEGDDASCLNLNRISNPRILGVDPSDLTGRFSFISFTPFLVKSSPWNSLDTLLNDNTIPAIADETVIKWGLGKKAGDILLYTNSSGDTIRLMLIGGLASSVFQGSIIISDMNFRKNFPDKGGSSVFLVEGDPGKSGEISEELRSVFRDHGWEITPAAQRLAEFNSVTNTYLTIFMVLGMFAIIIGTVGMGIVLVRSLQERRKEIAMLRAIGFGKTGVMRLFLTEYLILFLSGILTGALTSVIATFPSLVHPGSDVSFATVGVITAILLLNGIFWIVLLTGFNLSNKGIIESLRNE